MLTDFKSSIVVFLVALPLCLGIALASQSPLASGLIAGLIGGLIVGAISGSQLSVSGPAAGLAVIVVASIQQLGSFSAFCVAVLISGLFQMVFAYFRAGKLGNFFPTSVIRGMLSAIGLILILKQIPHAVGFDIDFMGDEDFIQARGENTFYAILLALKSMEVTCIIVAATSLAVIIGWDRVLKKVNHPTVNLIPGPLLAVISGILLTEFFSSTNSFRMPLQNFVELPYTGGLDSFFSQISLPDWSYLSDPRIYVVAATIAVVGSLESLLSLDAADKIDPKKRVSPKNRELFAQGAGNFLSGLLGGLPVTAVIVRTSANVSAGASTKLSTILHGLWLLLAIVLIPDLLNRIPLSALAAVLILVGYKLTKPELYVEMYQKGWDQFVPFVSTILAILVTDLLRGICIGMVIGAFFIFRRNHHRSLVVVSEGNDYLVRFMKDNSFLQKDRVINALRRIPDGSNVTIDGSKDVFIDTDIIELLEDFIARSPQKGINVELKTSSTALSPLFQSAS